MSAEQGKEIAFYPVMEKMLYELRPFAFMLLSIYALSQGGTSKLMLYCGMILFGCSAMILHYRLKARNFFER